MQIWVDADSCPVVIKNILFKAARRTGIVLNLVANQPLRIPKADNIRFLLVPAGADVADQKIVEQAEPNDLVITADIPLAAEVIKKGCQALNPNGELFSPDTIGARLSMRNFMESLRSGGIKTGGPEAMSQSSRKAFADELDRILTRMLKDNK
ncbi:YaiI/YqxD family protein [candidate division KSB1 bacterium]|nr:MAG: YaiI/YqxD family protein [candidate division KSB1 bacterium]